MVNVELRLDTPEVPESLTIEKIELLPATLESPAEIHSVRTLLWSPFTARPTMFVPGLLDAKVTPLKMVKWSVDLWPPWSANLKGTFRTRVASAGAFPLLSASFQDRVTVKSKKLIEYSQGLGTLSGGVEPEVSFKVTGLDFIKAIISLVVQHKVRVRSEAEVKWLLMSKSFDIDASIPVP